MTWMTGTWRGETSRNSFSAVGVWMWQGSSFSGTPRKRPRCWADYKSSSTRCVAIFLYHTTVYLISERRWIDCTHSPIRPCRQPVWLKRTLTVASPSSTSRSRPAPNHPHTQTPPPLHPTYHLHDRVHQPQIPKTCCVRCPGSTPIARRPRWAMLLVALYVRSNARPMRLLVWQNGG